MTARPDLPFTIELSQEEILEDLFWPHPPPGRWRLEPPEDERHEEALKRLMPVPWRRGPSARDSERTLPVTNAARAASYE
jgi:hypothetical protein